MLSSAAASLDGLFEQPPKIESILSFLTPKGNSQVIFPCAHRTTYMFLPSLLVSLSWNGAYVGPTAAVERAHSDRARSGSKGSA